MHQAQKKGKKAHKGACSRGNQEESNGGDDGNNNVAQPQQCSDNYYLSDDDSLEMTAACSNVSSASKKSSSSAAGGKARAGRGAATDPQSLYARVTRLLKFSRRQSRCMKKLHVVSCTCLLLSETRLILKLSCFH